MSSKKKLTKLEVGEIYQYTEDKAFKLLDPLEFKYKGITLRHYDKLNEQRKATQERIRHYEDKLKPYVQGDNLFDMLEKLLKNQEAFIQGYGDYVFQMNDEGYITKVVKGHEPWREDIPDDVDKGYYRIKNGKLKRDDERMKKTWTLM